MIGALGGPGDVLGQSPEVLEPGVNDVGPLSASLRVARPDLQMAADFDRVYRAADGSGMLMRTDGALTAMFRESEYVPSRTGQVAVIPAGTVWVIGEVNGGCTQPSKQVCPPQPAQRAFMLPGPTSAAPRPTKKPVPAGALAPAAKPLALKVGDAVSSPTDARINLSVVGSGAIGPERAGAPDAAAAPSSLPRAFDMSDEFYRRARLREIARRYGPRE